MSTVAVWLTNHHFLHPLLTLQHPYNLTVTETSRMSNALNQMINTATDAAATKDIHRKSRE